MGKSSVEIDLLYIELYRSIMNHLSLLPAATHIGNFYLITKLIHLFAVKRIDPQTSSGQQIMLKYIYLLTEEEHNIKCKVL